MEQKTNALKNASKVVSILSKIGYTAMIVMFGLCVAMLIYLAVTGGDTSVYTVGETNFFVFDATNTTPAELTALCPVLIVMSCFLFTIFLLAYQMFHAISLTGEPFEDKYGKRIRQIGILTAAMPIGVGVAESIASALTKTDLPSMYTDLPGIVIGVILFCLSYIIDYGCELRKRAER